MTTWLVGFAPVVYLALSGGGYDTIARSELGLVAWWSILVGALVSVLPRACLTRAAWIAVALLGGFLLWTGIAVAWSSSQESTLLEVARVATYLGAFVLSLCVVRIGTARALLNGVASAIALVAGLAVLYRLLPSPFPADSGARFYEVAQLQWPFEYADAVGEFAAIGLPLILAIALSGRTVAGRLAAAGGFVVMAVCLAMTTSSGALMAAVVGVGVFALLGPRHTWLSRSHRQRLVVVILAGLALAVGLAVLTGLAHQLWVDFKQPHIGGQLSFSGSHRYQYWQAAIGAFDSSPWHGIGPGTFQFYWAQHNSLGEFVLNAHSLYFETLAEAGIVGLVLVVGFFGTVLVAGGRRAAKLAGPDRPAAAAAVAGVAAFCGAAGFDWVWQIGALPVVAVMLSAVALNWCGEQERRRANAGSARVGRIWARAALALVAVGALAVIIVPLSETVAVRNSRAAAAGGHFAEALSHAATARRLEQGAATPLLQRALILEQLDRPGPALEALAESEARESPNWRIWLLASRIATEAGRPGQALADYRRARALNPTSPLFTQAHRLVPIAGKPLEALVVPPGKAGANQYFETMPGVAGNYSPPQAGRLVVRFDTTSLAALGRGQAVAGDLARLSGDGKATARLAADTAWRPQGADAPPARPALRHGGPGTLDPAGSFPLSAIAATVGGSDQGGLGAGLPLLLGGGLIGGFCLWRARARDD